jgi:hypothetical protein
MDHAHTTGSSAVSSSGFAQSGHAAIREVMPAVAFFTGVAVICSLARVVAIGWLPVMAIHLGLAACLLAATLVRERIPGGLLALAVTAVFFVLAAIGLPFFGLLGAGYGSTLVACLFAAVCCGPRVAYGLAAAYGLLTVVMAGVVTLSDYRFPLDAESYVYAPTSWALHVAAVFVFVVPAVHFVTRHQELLAEKNEALLRRSEQLAEALQEAKTLRGIVPICSSCKKIRNDRGYWERVEVYLSGHTEGLLSHGFCPECAEKQRQQMRADMSQGEAT